MAFEAYSVAVKLSLINHVSSGLLMISKGLAATGSDVDKLNAKLASIGKQAAIGGAMFAGGLGIASLFKAPLEESRKFQNEVARFQSLGLGEKVTNDAVSFAKGMNTYGTSIRENLGLLRDAQTVFGDFHEAQMVAPLLSKMKFANSALYGEEGGAMKDKAFMDMLKVIELRGGLSSEEAFLRQANMVQKVQTATGGRVGANEFLNFLKTGGVAAKGLKDENFYYAMEPLIQELGGHGVGTGFMSAYQNLVQGRTTQRAANELMRIGMLNPAMVDYDKIGNIKQVKPGALKGQDMFVSAPQQWLENILLPAFASKGITGNQNILNEIGAIMTNRTGAKLFSTMFQQREIIAKNYHLNAGAAGIDELDRNAKQTMTGKQIELAAKWADLQLKLGDVILPMAIKALDRLNPALVRLGAWIETHPKTVTALTTAFIGLSAFLIGGGLINMVIAAGRGFWLLGGAMRFLAISSIPGLLPGLALFGTRLVMIGTEIATTTAAFVMSSGFVRGALMAFLAPIRLIATTFFTYFITPLGLLLGPVGLVIAGLSAGVLLLWNNWTEIRSSLIGMWSGIKTGFIQLFHGDIGGAFSSFKHVFLLGWQTIFNTLIAGANKILPSSMQIDKLHFADQQGGDRSKIIAPVPIPGSPGGPQVVQINLDGKKLGEAVIGQMARAAARPQTSPQGFDLLRSPIMPGTSSSVVPRG